MHRPLALGQFRPAQARLVRLDQLEQMRIDLDVALLVLLRSLHSAGLDLGQGFLEEFPVDCVHDGEQEVSLDVLLRLLGDVGQVG